MFHATRPDAIFHVPNWIGQTKIHGEFLNEDRKISVPRWNGIRVVEIGSKPLLGSAPKIQDHEKDLVVIGGEILCAFSKMEIALGEGGIEFSWIGTIKGIRVLEIRLHRMRSR
jgi:hypothetical protein